MGNLSIQTNSANDIFIGQDGNLAMASGILALEQDCEHALKTQFGEMFLQPNDGMPTLTDVWLNKNIIRWVAIARRTLKRINGVLQVKSFNTDFQGESFRYETNILTVYSPTLLIISGRLDS